MSGLKSKRKGSRTELEFAKLVGGQRVPLSGAMGFLDSQYKGDVKGMGLVWECKARKDGFKQIYKYLEGVDALAVKADRKEWLAIVPISTFKKGWKGGR